MSDLFRLHPRDVGRRVIVRHRLADGSATDVRGRLRSLDADRLTLAAEPPADTDAVALSQVIAAKVIPPAPVRPSSSADSVQRVADLGWPGLERRHLGDWVLRASDGFTGRANSVLVVGDPDLPSTDAIQVAESFYADRGLPAKFQVPFPVTGPDDPATELDAALAGRGYTCDSPTYLMTADLRRITPEREQRLVFSDEPDAAFLSLYKYRGGDLPPIAHRVLTAADRQAFGSLLVDGLPVAVGRVAVAEGWVGITAMQVADSHLRQGLGTALLRGLVGWGLREGGRYGYLQVTSANAAAIALYERLGFTFHHRYHYRTRQP